MLYVCVGKFSNSFNVNNKWSKRFFLIFFMPQNTLYPSDVYDFGIYDYIHLTNIDCRHTRYITYNIIIMYWV